MTKPGIQVKFEDNKRIIKRCKLRETKEKEQTDK
jgi:hypothetical protein